MDEQNYYKVQNRNLKDVGNKGNFEKNQARDLFMRFEIRTLLYICTII